MSSNVLFFDLTTPFIIFIITFVVLKVKYHNAYEVWLLEVWFLFMEGFIVLLCVTRRSRPSTLFLLIYLRFGWSWKSFLDFLCEWTHFDGLKLKKEVINLRKNECLWLWYALKLLVYLQNFYFLYFCQIKHLTCQVFCKSNDLSFKKTHTKMWTQQVNPVFVFHILMDRFSYDDKDGI